MCGVVGFISGEQGPGKDPDALKPAIDTMRHRGPDGSGLAKVGNSVLGHVRLSIIDVQGGVQPMSTKDNQVTLTYNGEIYNFLELRAELEALGHSFLTRSDTEVLLRSYVEWGVDCVARLRGMFAFAVIDLRRGKALLARDRLGQKPLFYTRKEGGIYFSSELEPLWKIAGPFRMDLAAMDQCLAWQFIPPPMTIYQDVQCLCPGHLIEVDLQDISMQCRSYWELSFSEDSELSRQDWEREIDAKLKEATSLRLMSDVPFGAFLSGGTDSSLVVGYMADIMDLPVETFSIGSNEPEIDESIYATEVARINGTNHTSEYVDESPLDMLPIVVRHFGQPFADASAIPTYQVSRLARRKVKMVLSGDGGDENFAGYNTYESVLRSIAGHVPAGKNATKLWRQAARAIAVAVGLRPRLTAPGPGALPSLVDLRSSVYQHFSAAQRRALLLPEFSSVVDDRVSSLAEILTDGRTPILSRLQFADIQNYLPGDILTKVDAMSMANSLEVRSPFLDHELVELAARMPITEKLRVTEDGQYHKKDILQRLARRRYPRRIVDRPKKGFGVPLGAWFNGPMRSVVSEKLFRSDFLPGYFDMQEVKKLIDGHSSRQDNSARLWNLLVLDAWMSSHSEALAT